MAVTGAVLLVDAFPDEQNMYAEFLRFSGFDLVFCAAPSRVLAMATEHPISAVVTRIRQPGAIDGIELTRQIKTDERTRHIPVVIITTYTDPVFESLALQAGCDRFLLLPCLPDRLAAELRQLLDRPASDVGSLRDNGSGPPAGQVSE